MCYTALSTFTHASSSVFCFCAVTRYPRCLRSHSIHLVSDHWTPGCFQHSGITIMPQAITIYTLNFTPVQVEVGLPLSFCKMMPNSPLQGLFGFTHSSVKWSSDISILTILLILMFSFCIILWSLSFVANIFIKVLIRDNSLVIGGTNPTTLFYHL